MSGATHHVTHQLHQAFAHLTRVESEIAKVLHADDRQAITQAIRDTRHALDNVANEIETVRSQAQQAVDRI